MGVWEGGSFFVWRGGLGLGLGLGTGQEGGGFNVCLTV